MCVTRFICVYTATHTCVHLHGVGYTILIGPTSSVCVCVRGVPGSQGTHTHTHRASHRIAVHSLAQRSHKKIMYNNYFCSSTNTYVCYYKTYVRVCGCGVLPVCVRARPYVSGYLLYL